MQLKKQLQEKILKTSPEYLWLSRLRKWFIFSIIGVCISFFQYYQIMPVSAVPVWLVFIIKWWAIIAPITLLFLSVYCYAKKTQIPQAMELISNLENNKPMPEQKIFDKHINPDNSALNETDMAHREIENKVIRNSWFYGLMALVAFYIQLKSSAYQGFGFYLSQIGEFLNILF